MRVQFIMDDTPVTLYVRRLHRGSDTIHVMTAHGLKIDRFQFNFMQIIEATEVELKALRDAGYWAAAPPPVAQVRKAA